MRVYKREIKLKSTRLCVPVFDRKLIYEAFNTTNEAKLKMKVRCAMLSVANGIHVDIIRVCKFRGSGIAFLTYTRTRQFLEDAI